MPSGATKNFSVLDEGLNTANTGEMPKVPGAFPLSPVKISIESEFRFTTYDEI